MGLFYQQDNLKSRLLLELEPDMDLEQEYHMLTNDNNAVFIAAVCV